MGRGLSLDEANLRISVGGGFPVIRPLGLASAEVQSTHYRQLRAIRAITPRKRRLDTPTKDGAKDVVELR